MINWLTGLGLIVIMFIFVKLFIMSIASSSRHQKWCHNNYIDESYLNDDGTCGGIVGGDRHTGYLSYSCIDYPYRKEIEND